MDTSLEITDQVPETPESAAEKARLLATPETFVRALTPSGIEVHYEWAPKRLYRVRQLPARRPEDFDWVEVPSVTKALEVLDKPALPWWGMRVGIEGTIEMFNRGILRGACVDHDREILVTPGPIGVGTAGLVVAGLEQVEKLLTDHKLTVNHVRDTAGVRGQSCHDAFEIWMREGIVPDVGMYPPEEQSYIAGLVQFLKDVDPEPVASEVMVGSVEYGFAGRYDARIHVPKACDVVYKVTPKRGAHYASLEPGLLLIDLKTSKGVYPSHSRQLEAYEGASIECGYEPTVARGILHISSEGYYEFVRSTATFEDFLPVLEVWKSDQRMKARKR